MDKKVTINPRIKELTKKITGKRAKTVVDYILKHGVITTEDLERLGYKHPPRAVRDVRENGIPIETVRVKGLNGKSIAAYTFGDPDRIEEFKLGGRRVFSSAFKMELFKRQKGMCAICSESYDEKFFQIDHRVPYEVSGDSETELNVEDFMLLCATCNRIKGRATETGCRGTCFKSGNMRIIKSCFWASPENYTHICMEPIRRVELVWKGNTEIGIFEKFKKEAKNREISVSEYIKTLLEE